MLIRDIMKYIESEYDIINSTPCEVCGGSYIAESLEIHVIDNIPYDISMCVCGECGHEKAFRFFAPFINDEALVTTKKKLN